MKAKQGWYRSPFLLVVVLAATVDSLSAQGTTSRLTGVVSDPAGAKIADAIVVLTNERQGISFSTKTTASGIYVFDSVQVGTYSVSVEKPGFKKYVSAGNVLAVNQPTTVNVTLEIGGVAEQVLVEATAERVQTSSSGNLGNIVDQQTIVSLPIVGLRGRNPLNFVLFQPGVVEGANTGSGDHVHGARDRAWNYTLDGIDVNESSAGGGNSTPLHPNPDSLAEFQVVTSNFTAEFGRSSGGQVTMITRSGTNEFHGSAFEFYQTPRFQANEYQNNLNNIPKRQLIQHIAGFSLGGPIVKDRTFFFANLQILRTRETRSVTRMVYTANARRGLFRYVQGGRNFPAGTATPTVDPNGNVLPGNNIGTYNIVANDPRGLGLDPAVQKVLDLTPLPNNFSVGDGLNTAGFTFSAFQHEQQYDAVIKVDHVINDHNIVYLRYAQGQQNTLGDSVNGGLQAFPGTPRLVDTFRDPKNLAINWRTTPNSSLTNELVVGFNRFAFDFDNPDPNYAQNPIFTLITNNGLTNPLDNTPTIENARRLRTYQLVDNLTYVRGSHTFRSGVNFRYQQHLDDRSSVAGVDIAPSLDFSRTINTVDPTRFRLPTDINSSNDRPRLEGAINDLLGRVGSISQGFVALGNQFGPAGTRFSFDGRYGEYDVYAQDTWRIRPHLSLDLGLRWEPRFSPRAPNNLILRPDQAVVLGQAPSNTIRWVEGPLFKDAWKNFGPSIGFAWDPFGTGKTSIRANYRLAYDRMNTFVLSSTIFQSEPGLTLAVINNDFGQGDRRLQDGVPALAPPAGLAPDQLRQPAPFSTGTTTVVDPNMRYPRTNMWSLSLQRDLGWNCVVELNYVGRKGTSLYGAYDVNQVDIFNNGFLDAFNVVRAGGDSPLINTLMAKDSRLQGGETGSQALRRIFASDLSLGSVGSVAQQLAQRSQGGVPLVILSGLGPFFFQPFPQFAGAVRVLDSNDFSTYHAFEAQFQRHFKGGFGFQVSYTLSKSMDTRSFDPAFTTVSRGNLQSASSTPFDIRNRKLNFAPSDFDRRHALQGSWLFELPFGGGRRWASHLPSALDYVIGGWETAGIVRWFSGRPFTVYSGSNTLSNVNQSTASCTGCTPDMGHLFLDGTAGTLFYFDGDQRKLFSTPAPGQLGNTGRNFFIAPPFFDIDLTLAKRIRIGGKQNLELRVEMQNATNHPSFDMPTATITSTIFGRVRDSVTSAARKIQLAAKYNF